MNDFYINKQCSKCKWFCAEETTEHGLLGECIDALGRARQIVPFAINLEVSKVYGHGGKNCPCFDKGEC